MKTLKLGTLFILGLALVSCGGGKKNEEVKEKKEVLPVEAKTVTLSPFPAGGALGDYAEYFTFTGENGEEDITLTGIPEEVKEYASSAKGTIKAVVKIKMKPLPQKIYGFATYPSFPLYIYNADKEQPGGFTRLEMIKADTEALESLIKEGKGGEITVTYKNDFYEDSYNKIFEDAKYFRIENVDLTTEAEHNERHGSSGSSGSYSSDDDDDDEVASSSSSNNWDEILDDYEKYVDDLVSLAQKTKSGDPTAIADYASLLSDCQSVADKLQKAKGSLTAAQSKRYAKIAAKYAKLAK